MTLSDIVKMKEHAKSMGADGFCVYGHCGCSLDSFPACLLDDDGDFDDNGFFLVLSGVTSGSGHLFYANKSVPFDAYLKIGVNTDTYYIGLLAQQAAAT